MAIEETTLDRIDVIVAATTVLAQAELLRSIAVLMRAGVEITPEILEGAADNVAALANKATNGRGVTT